LLQVSFLAVAATSEAKAPQVDPSAAAHATVHASLRAPAAALPGPMTPAAHHAGLQHAFSAVRMGIRTTETHSTFRLLDARDKAVVFRHAFGADLANAAHAVGRVLTGREREEPQYARAMFHFINGRNNLQEDAVKDLGEIVAGSRGDTRTVHVVEMATLDNPVAHRYRV